MHLTLDLTFLLIVLAAALIGSLVGFGRGLRWFTKGIVGFILSFFFCYVFGGIILKLPFVAKLLKLLASTWDKRGAFYDFLKAVHLEIILYYIILFFVAQLVRILIVHLISKVFEWKAKGMKVINRILGAVLFVAVTLLFTMFVFQIVDWIGGQTEADFVENLHGWLRLDRLFEHNPLNSLVKYIKDTF